MILKIRKAPKARSELFSIALPAYIWLQDYHDGKIVQDTLRKFGLRVKVKELKFEGVGYKFIVKAG